MNDLLLRGGQSFTHTDMILFGFESLHIVKRNKSAHIVSIPLANSQESSIRRESHCCDAFDLFRLLYKSHVFGENISDAQMLANWINYIWAGAVLSKIDAISYLMDPLSEISTERISNIEGQ